MAFIIFSKSRFLFCKARCAFWLFSVVAFSWRFSSVTWTLFCLRLSVNYCTRLGLTFVDAFAADLFGRSLLASAFEGFPNSLPAFSGD